MKTKKILFILALLCAVVQGAWAADRNYEYPTQTKPSFYASYGGKSNVVVINTEAELAYVTVHFDEDSDFDVDDDDWSELNYYLNADLDMGTTYSWLPLGRESYWVTRYTGTFWGNGHTIKFKIWDLDEENQGLFATIGKGGEVHDVNVVCDINTKRDCTGGIAGENRGLIQNCTVTANIVNKDHDWVGGIVGDNCPYGTVLDCRVSGMIKGTGSAKYVGGITGRNIYGADKATIRNCWVSADVSSEHYNAVTSAYVGGIAGYNNSTIEYCCMTGNVSNPKNDCVGGMIGWTYSSGHDTNNTPASTNSSRGPRRIGHPSNGGLHTINKNFTFYGTITNNHSRSSDVFGGGNGDEIHESFTDDELAAYLNRFSGNDLYRYAIKYPFAINVTTEGYGIIETSAGGETGITRWRPGQTVTLTQKAGTVQSVTVKDADGNNVELQGQAHDNSSFWFVMPKRDVNVTVVFSKPAWLNHAGTEADPISISSAADWNDFASYVSGGINFSGKYVKLTDDISVSDMAGTDDAKSFQGTFDGNGKTLTFTRGTSSTPFAEDYCAPFRHVKNAVMKNLHVGGTIYTSAMKAAGFVGESHGALIIENCRSSVDINATKNGDGTHGGFVSTLSGANNAISIIGCVFDGSFATTNGTTNCGGFVGWPVYNKSTIKNSLMIPTSVAEGMLNNTFSRWHTTYEPTIQNCYFATTTNLPANQGKQALSVTGDENVTVSVSGIEGNTVATYSVSGITAYSGGLACNGTCYYGDGDVVRLTLSNTAPSLADGLSYNYTASAGSLSGTILTMPGQNVTIGITAITTDWATVSEGTESKPYLIYTTEQLDLLAQRVNAGNSYNGSYFKLMNDIAYSHNTDWDNATSTENNFTAIGYYKASNDMHEFSGDFNGDGYTISGIRIYKYGSTNGDGYQGLFGYASSYAKIHDLTLADTRITGHNYVGGIVGSNYSDITNCHVTPTVAIHAVQADASSHGGIVGYGQYGDIYYSTSAATLTTADASQSSSYGAIVGHNQGGYVKHCLAIGATVPAAKDNTYGAICGDSHNWGDYPISIEANYYINCTVAGTANATGVGINGADLTTGTTATKRIVPAYAITTGNAENFSIEFDGGTTSAGGGITFYDTGFKYDDVLYAAGGQTVSLTLSTQSMLYDATGYQASAGTFSGTGNPYTLTMPAQDVTISVSDWTPSGLTIDTDGNYLISSTDDWNTFCEYVANGTTFSGKTLKLNADGITVTASNMVGTDLNHAFCGTFDGAGKTLTVSIGTAEEPFAERFCGPFRYTYGATIKNLRTTGHIYTADINAGGVVGRNGTESITLQNVSSDVAIHSTVSGSGYHGGLMGYAINASLSGCAFTGSLLGVESHHIGGLLGQKSDTDDSNATFTNCLFAPAEVAVSGYCSYPFAAGAQNLTSIGNSCYYATPMGGVQGIQIYTVAIEGVINKKVTAIDGNTYYMPCTVSGVQEGYLYTGVDIAVTAPTVTAADGSKLTLGTDFTFSTNPAIVNARGEYKLTVSGTGNCSGSQTFAFVVGDYTPVTSTTTTLNEGEYMVYNDVTINGRITISGSGENGVILYLGEGTTLRAAKGIELSEGNRLTIYGPGALLIDKCDAKKSGIGAETAGTLTIRGGQLDITGAEGAAGIGSDAGKDASGSLTLIWTDASDYVKCSSYSVENILFSKQFVVDNEETIATTSNIGGERIVPAVVLSDADDNSDVLAGYAGQATNVVLNGRTLYLDGKWNTICLPFDQSISAVKGAEARTLTAASIEGTTLHLTFGDPVDVLEAGTPYIIKFAKEDDYVADGTHDYLSPVFYGVTIDATNHDYDNGKSGDARVRFLGTYAKKSFDGEDKSILFMGADNTLYYPLDGASIGAQRAYFKIGEDDAQEARQLTAFCINFGDDDSTQGVTTPLSNRRGAGGEAWYTLDGRRLQGKPTQRGIYVNTGRKVIVK